MGSWQHIGKRPQRHSDQQDAHLVKGHGAQHAPGINCCARPRHLIGEEQEEQDFGIVVQCLEKQLQHLGDCLCPGKGEIGGLDLPGDAGGSYRQARYKYRRHRSAMRETASMPEYAP